MKYILLTILALAVPFSEHLPAGDTYAIGVPRPRSAPALTIGVPRPRSAPALAIGVPRPRSAPALAIGVPRPRGYGDRMRAA